MAIKIEILVLENVFNGQDFHKCELCNMYWRDEHKFQYIFSFQKFFIIKCLNFTNFASKNFLPGMKEALMHSKIRIVPDKRGYFIIVQLIKFKVSFFFWCNYIFSPYVHRHLYRNYFTLKIKMIYLLYLFLTNPNSLNNFLFFFKEVKVFILCSKITFSQGYWPLKAWLLVLNE